MGLNLYFEDKFGKLKGKHMLYDYTIKFYELSF